MENALNEQLREIRDKQLRRIGGDIVSVSIAWNKDNQLTVLVTSRIPEKP